MKYLCGYLRVSRSGYYAWRSRPVSSRAREDGALFQEVESVFRAHKARYGSPRVHEVLRQRGMAVGRKRVARLMQEHGLKARMSRLYRRHAPGLPRAMGETPNRRLSRPRPTGPNQQWAGDITYIRHDGRWRYLAVVMDLYSRRVIGWALGGQRTSELTRAALAMALRRRTPEPQAIFHTDRGAEYRCATLQALLVRYGMQPSLNRPRYCTDNAEVESFFHTLKGELIHGSRFQTETDLDRRIGAYLTQYYNRERLHSSLGYRSPEYYEAANA